MHVHKCVYGATTTKIEEFIESMAINLKYIFHGILFWAWVDYWGDFKHPNQGHSSSNIFFFSLQCRWMGRDVFEQT